jgi:anti-repressor protein
MNTLSFTSKDGRAFCTAGTPEEPLFVAIDLCAVLGMANTADALGRLDDDEKGIVLIYTLGGAQEMSVVTESGLYSLILGSRKPEAKAFKRWVTHEVLPATR